MHSTYDTLVGRALETGSTSESTVVVAVGYDELTTLKLVVLDGGRSGPVKLSCSGVANRFDVSNQTASHRLQRLGEANFIDREAVSDGQWITITDTGKSVFRQGYTDYRRIFEASFVVILEGQITGGIGEGRHYISFPSYTKQFKDRLGYEPFPGTPNVRLDDDAVRAHAGMTALDTVPIDGWKDDGHIFGPATCYAASVTVGGNSYEPVHIIVPERAHHDESQLEIIASDKLHDEPDLDDGNAVTVRVEKVEYK